MKRKVTITRRSEKREREKGLHNLQKVCPSMTNGRIKLLEGIKFTYTISQELLKPHNA